MCWYQLKNRCWVGLVVIPVPTEKISEYLHCLELWKYSWFTSPTRTKKMLPRPKPNPKLKRQVAKAWKMYSGSCCNTSSMPGEHTNKHLTQVVQKIWFCCCAGVYPDSCTLAWFLVSKPFSSVTVCILFSESLTVKVRTATKGHSNACHLKMNMQDQSQFS